MPTTERRSRALDVAYLVTSTLACLGAFYLWSAALLQTPGDTASVGMLPAFPFAALIMYTALALGAGVALAHTLVAALLMDVVAGAGFRVVPALVVSGVVAAVLVVRCTRRNGVLHAGVLAGAAGGVAAGVAVLATGDGSPRVAALTAASALLGGSVSGPLLLAVSPLAEWLFGHITLLGLLDALSYDHPLLRDMMTRAPGTFQHSINVSLLADAGARAVDGDALMARVGALYHDVGKTKAPEFFFENQTGPNPHDDMPPIESAAIVRAHVTDGVRMVLDHRLGQRVADFVREHHGTSEMRALLSKLDEDPTDEDAFRYPGPMPQSEETGVLMIVDQVEATARAVKPETESDCAELVRKTIDRLKDEGQLDESGLDERALTALTFAVARTLHAMHHRRIDYPQERRRPGARLVLRPRSRAAAGTFL
jgi:putative nucleotidyltransferase with HDIG domain